MRRAYVIGAFVCSAIACGTFSGSDNGGSSDGGALDASTTSDGAASDSGRESNDAGVTDASIGTTSDAGSPPTDHHGPCGTNYAAWDFVGTLSSPLGVHQANGSLTPNDAGGPDGGPFGSLAISLASASSDLGQIYSAGIPNGSSFFCLSVYVRVDANSTLAMSSAAATVIQLEAVMDSTDGGSATGQHEVDSQGYLTHFVFGGIATAATGEQGTVVTTAWHLLRLEITPTIAGGIRYQFYLDGNLVGDDSPFPSNTIMSGGAFYLGPHTRSFTVEPANVSLDFADLAVESL